MESIWNKCCKMPEFPTLETDIQTDILIIGGGIAGILCAEELHRRGADYALVEADTICRGITCNTTAKITAQHGLIYDKLLHTYGIEKASQYLSANRAALKAYRSLCKEIDCDFEIKDSFVYSTTSPKKLHAELQSMHALGINGQWEKTVPLPLRVSGAIRFPDQAQFHPLKFLSAISQPLNIYEHTRVAELVGTKAITDHGTISANQIIVATHFPFLNKHGLYPMKLYQHRSYVIALEGGPDVNGMYVDESEKGLSFRNYHNLLLLGGGGHQTGKQGGAYRELRSFARLHFPEAREVAAWATQDCMTLDGIPYIGPYSARTEGLYVTTGFNKWGMTSAMAAALILADLVQGKHNPWAEIFSPSRSMLHPQLVINGFEAVGNLLTPTAKRCPHMGCALKWNKQEHTWDCPCHGSRFTKDGKLLDNPATGDLRQ